jgi:hypothetical protein
VCDPSERLLGRQVRRRLRSESGAPGRHYRLRITAEAILFLRRSRPDSPRYQVGLLLVGVRPVSAGRSGRDQPSGRVWSSPGSLPLLRAAWVALRARLGPDPRGPSRRLCATPAVQLLWRWPGRALGAGGRSCRITLARERPGPGSSPRHTCWHVGRGRGYQVVGSDAERSRGRLTRVEADDSLCEVSVNDPTTAIAATVASTRRLGSAATTGRPHVWVDCARVVCT